MDSAFLEVVCEGYPGCLSAQADQGRHVVVAHAIADRLDEDLLVEAAAKDGVQRLLMDQAEIPGDQADGRSLGKVAFDETEDVAPHHAQLLSRRAPPGGRRASASTHGQGVATDPAGSMSEGLVLTEDDGWREDRHELQCPWPERLDGVMQSDRDVDSRARLEVDRSLRGLDHTGSGHDVDDLLFLFVNVALGGRAFGPVANAHRDLLGMGRLGAD